MTLGSTAIRAGPRRGQVVVAIAIAVRAGNGWCFCRRNVLITNALGFNVQPHLNLAIFDRNLQRTDYNLTIAQLQQSLRPCLRKLRQSSSRRLATESFDEGKPVRNSSRKTLPHGNSFLFLEQHLTFALFFGPTLIPATRC